MPARLRLNCYRIITGLSISCPSLGHKAKRALIGRIKKLVFLIAPLPGPHYDLSSMANSTIALFVRPDGRLPDQLRPVHFRNGIAPYAAGSTLIEWGNTRVICGVTVEESVPRWMKEQNVPGGWITAEYSMLPYSTLTRKARDISKGKIDGRSQEIQRLIGRSMRAALDLEKTGPRTFCVDCDVLQADGGTRTAAITGSYVAMALALRSLQAAEKLPARSGSQTGCGR